MNPEIEESKKPIEAFEVFLDLYAQAEKLKKELKKLDCQLRDQKEVIGNALGIYEGKYAFTSTDGTVVIVELFEYQVCSIEVVEKLEVKK